MARAPSTPEASSVTLDPGDLDAQTLYKLLTGSVVPRPIAWVSTLDAEGRPNLAPFSYFSAVSAKPPHLLFCPGLHGPDRPKDTLKNVREGGDFVVNLVTEALAEAMNLSAATVAAGVSEFELAGVTPVPSARVRPPRVGESPVHFECRVVHIYDVGEHPGGGSVVIGEVVAMHFLESVLIGRDKIDLATLRPIGRLAGPSYVRVTDVFEMVRPRVEEVGKS